ncbi:asparagine synthase (glutamine-hydrolysing) [Kineothrix alysoides]|uniref:asparagine synthase (glutamine-hydrolyzing) n=1 Tax=Kineothrix alysoides TaxID=1469948 RepID=A0A4R1R224_9FIRM|nr:asparagine synthase (glutamine-hydrolyzing) [Kineothrix alysoides]TCL59413.1 asparagine synthase (glutamine-hydrolysing) [Kineothrix alysoides]
MCGIAGFCNLSGDWNSNINRMNHRMLHRGPDASGVWRSEEEAVVLGHQRLSIMDLTPTGAQPMESASGRFVIVFNGEIYNYKKIAKKLLEEKKVAQFRGTCDTEVLLEAMEAYGVEQAIGMCKGMFAIALYDKKERVLFLVRDRVGEKPLYYGFVGEGTFAFASEIGCIAALENFKNEINTSVLDIYFTHGYIPAPYSVYKDIYKLEAGSILKIEAPYHKENISISAYWSMKEAAVKGQSDLFTGSEEEAAEELERLLKESIEEQMVADVPVGAFLSAGIDSSTIVALMQSLNHNKVRSFTIGMTEEGYNEAAAAKEIAKHLGTDHTELYITKQDAIDVIPKLGYMFGEPFADSSQIPTYLVSKMTKEHVTVSLSGDAGDELFGGYTSYESVSRIWNKMKGIPYFVRKPCSELVLHSPLAKNQIYRTKATLLGAKTPGRLYEISYETDPLTKKISRSHVDCPYKYSQFTHYMEEVNHNIMLMDMLMYHPDDILVKVDRAAMAVSLETRVPMLDKDVVEFAWTLPIEYKRQGKTGKKVLRDVLYKYVPREMMERPKKGFSIPVDKWLLEPELRNWAEALIDRKTLQQQGILDADVVWKIWEDYTKNGVWRIQIWFILMFQEWMLTGKA